MTRQTCQKIFAALGFAALALIFILLPFPHRGRISPLEVSDSPNSRNTELEAPLKERARLTSAREGIVQIQLDAPRTSRAEHASKLIGSCRTVTGDVVKGVLVRYRAQRSFEDSEPYTVEGESNDLGNFSLDLPSGVEMEDHQVQVSFTKPGFATRQASYLPTADERGIDLGVVLMEPGGMLVGTVTSRATGKPMASASLKFTAAHAIAADNLSPDYFNWAGSRSDTEGRFALKHPLRAGEYFLLVRGKGIASSLPKSVRVDAGVENHIAITVEPSLPIRGLILSDGGPLDGLRVSAWNSESGQSISLGDTTDAIGSFELWPEGETSEDLIEVDLEPSSLRDYRSTPLYTRWGADDVVLRAELIKPDWVEVHFTNADFSRTIHMCVPTSSSDLQFEEVSVDENGVLRIDRARQAGRFALFAQGPSSYSPESYDLAVVGPIEVDFVSAAPPVAFDVVDDAGNPLEGATVECLLAPGSSIEDPRPQFYPRCFQRGLRLPGVVTHWGWDASATTADGRASVHVPDLAGFTTYWRVRADGFSDQAALFKTGARQVEVRLDTAAAWRVELSGYWPSGVWVVAQSDEGEVIRSSRISGTSVSPRQEFLLSGLSLKSWHIHARLGVMDRTLKIIDTVLSGSGQVVAEAKEHVASAGPVPIRGLATGGEPWQLWLVEEGDPGHTPPAGKPLATTSSDSVDLPLLLLGNHRILATSGTASKLGRMKCSEVGVELIQFD